MLHACTCAWEVHDHGPIGLLTNALGDNVHVPPRVALRVWYGMVWYGMVWYILDFLARSEVYTTTTHANPL